MEQGLREKENVYFVRMTGEDMSWLPAYYEAHGTPVEVTLADTVAGIFEIYRVSGNGKWDSVSNPSIKKMLSFPSITLSTLADIKFAFL